MKENNIMNYTEKYELPLIEGTDVIDYAPFNEGMQKIENAIEHNETLVQEAVDDVAEMGDTLNQKVEEVNEALEQTESDVNASLEQTTDSLTEMVNERLNSISTFFIARRYIVPSDTYYFGDENGSLILPITSISPTIKRGVDLTNNRFYVPYASQFSTPVSKVDLDIVVEPTGGEGVYNGANNVRIELVRYNPGTGSDVVCEHTINASVKTPIHFSTLLIASGGTTFAFRLSCGYTQKLTDYITLTVENIGMNN